MVLEFPWLNQTSLLSKFSEIHFSSPGNDFWWWVFWLPIKSLNSPQTITAGGVTKTCYKQLRWIYYNAARGGRLWPLDQETLGLLTWTWGIWYSNLQVNWWLYTNCWTDQYGIFWVITYIRWWTTSYIIAWTKLNYQQNDYISEFANTFEYFNNVTPLWYFWDSVGGIGFVGWAITWSENLLWYLNNTWSISSSFLTTGGNSTTSSSGQWSVILTWDSQAQDTMWNILIQGNVILSKAIDVYEKKALLGNLERRTILINSDINSATVINLAKKNAEVLCRGKTYLVWWSWPTYLPSSSQEKVLCYKNTDNLEINLSQDLHKDKTIIVRNWNITLTNTMTKDSSALDVFIDEWNLFIKSPITTKTNFNQDWYPSDTNITNSWIFIKGNFVVNGLLMWKDISDSVAPIENKVHLLGKVAFLNTPTTPSQWRITQVNNVLWTTIFQDNINLENVFSRYCDMSWNGSDGTSCWWSTSSATVTPFVVLNASYPSNIIK